MGARITTDLTHRALAVTMRQRQVAEPLLHLGSRQPIYGGTVPTEAHAVWSAVFHESARELLGQCRRGEFLCELENRTDLSPTIYDQARGASSHLHLGGSRSREV